MGKFIGFTKNGVSKALAFCSALSFAVMLPVAAYADTSAMLASLQTKVSALAVDLYAIGVVILGITLAVIAVKWVIRLTKAG